MVKNQKIYVKLNITTVEHKHKNTRDLISYMNELKKWMNPILS